jgi:adenosylcobinamide-phosphate synthase
MSDALLAGMGVALGAILIEWLFGYPDALFRRIGHPVTWIGALIARLDRTMNRESQGPAMRRLAGVCAMALVATAAAATALAIERLAFAILPGWAALPLCAVLASTLFAQKSLIDHVDRVRVALGQSLKAGREAVSHIVGRDTRTLDEAGVSRAAVESLAENASDGVFAPLFWCALLGLPGIAVYKAVNTADSMIGHRTERHLAFGWAAARLDDLLNLPWSRLAMLLFAAAAAFVPGASPRGALRAALRDASRHQSPNAGWPEAALAGALGFKLGGPRDYDGECIDLPAMGDGRAELGPADIKAAMRLEQVAVGLGAALLALGLGAAAIG